MLQSSRVILVVPRFVCRTLYSDFGGYQNLKNRRFCVYCKNYKKNLRFREVSKILITLILQYWRFCVLCANTPRSEGLRPPQKLQTRRIYEIFMFRTSRGLHVGRSITIIISSSYNFNCVVLKWFLCEKNLTCLCEPLFGP